MTKLFGTLALATGVAVMAAGVFATPLILHDRTLPGTLIGTTPAAGLNKRDLAQRLAAYAETLGQEKVILTTKGETRTAALKDMGVHLNVEKTVAAIFPGGSSFVQTLSLTPELEVEPQELRAYVERELSDVLVLPQNATLNIVAGRITPVPGRSGEDIDILTLEYELKRTAAHHAWAEPIELVIITSPPPVQDREISAADALVRQLLSQGFELTTPDNSWRVTPYTVQRLMKLQPQTDPDQPQNQILGVAFDPVELEKYISTTIAPEVNRVPSNARFETKDGHLFRIGEPGEGRALDLAASVGTINQALAGYQSRAALNIKITAPEIASNENIDPTQFNTLLARGESDFAGSPANRRHNINVGTARYHGLLIAPGEEFSFNELLGPVTGEAGYKPELVIKQNKTIPEFGGGLCQVSTTVFRAAIHAGLPITERRNHAYAVAYYGKPGFDATIYPNVTDLKFTNDTVGYILMQSRVEDSRLVVELWGTADDREVSVTGPLTYDAKPNGAVKATLTREIRKNGEVVHTDTFRSNYRSPSLFPKNPPPPTPPAPLAPPA